MKDKKNVLLVCCHKKDVMATGEPYLPLHVGKEKAKVDLGITGDNTGDNISHKNPHYCELTGLYWAWKNLKDVDTIGLCHYRRYFDFNNQCRKVFPLTAFPIIDFDKIDLSVPKDLHLTPGTIILPRPDTYGHNLYLDYCSNLISDDFHTLRFTIKESYPEYYEAFEKVMYRNNKVSRYNMFIMNWTDFDDYCTWLFGLLEKVEKKIDISHYNPVQSRIFGYMGEYLTNVFAEQRKMKIIHKPVIWFNDSGDFWSKSPIKYLIRKKMNNIGHFFTKQRGQTFHLKR